MIDSIQKDQLSPFPTKILIFVHRGKYLDPCTSKTRETSNILIRMGDAYPMSNGF